MRMIINTTACGDAFNHPGRQQCQPGMGDFYKKLQENQDSYIDNAGWKINSISVYQL